MVEGGGVVTVGRMVAKDAEELEGLGAVVPDALEDCIDKVRCPLDGWGVKGSR
uniref:Uncharacterized protein n=1 Tax=Rhizophora mucronata TaxID=61149 RepID=A0A2P2NP96_RHIMU